MISEPSALALVSIIGASVLAGIAGAMGWFRFQRMAILKAIEDEKERVDKEIQRLVEEVKLVRTLQVTEMSDIRVLETEVVNSRSQLNQIFDITKELRTSMAALGKSFTDVLLEMREQRK